MRHSIEHRSSVKDGCHYCVNFPTSLQKKAKKAANFVETMSGRTRSKKDWVNVGQRYFINVFFSCFQGPLSETSPIPLMTTKEKETQPGLVILKTTKFKRHAELA